MTASQENFAIQAINNIKTEIVLDVTKVATWISKHDGLFKLGVNLACYGVAAGALVAIVDNVAAQSAKLCDICFESADHLVFSLIKERGVNVFLTGLSDQLGLTVNSSTCGPLKALDILDLEGGRNVQIDFSMNNNSVDVCGQPVDKFVFSDAIQPNLSGWISGTQVNAEVMPAVPTNLPTAVIEATQIPIQELVVVPTVGAVLTPAGVETSIPPVPVNPKDVLTVLGACVVAVVGLGTVVGLSKLVSGMNSGSGGEPYQPSGSGEGGFTQNDGWGDDYSFDASSNSSAAPALPNTGIGESNHGQTSAVGFTLDHMARDLDEQFKEMNGNVGDDVVDADVTEIF